MTILAWDGITLAADKRAISDGLSCTVTKIMRLSDGRLFGGCGDLSFCLAMKDWIEQGSKFETFPAAQRDKDDWQGCVLVDEHGLGVFERTPSLIRFEDPFYACGSGRDYALAAMHLGKSAEEAVKIASLFEVGCGNGVDSLVFHNWNRQN